MNIYPYKPIVKEHHKYCVYLTIYGGKLLPPFYIGSTYIDNIIKNNYHGSVASKKYKKIYEQELNDNPDKFRTIILRSTVTRRMASRVEYYIQRKNKVVRNNFFFNVSYAIVSDFYSWNEGIRGNDYLAFFSEEGLKNSKKSWKNKNEVMARDTRTGECLTVSKEDFGKYDYYVGHTKGSKQSQESNKKRKDTLTGQKRTTEQKKNYSKGALNRPHFKCQYCNKDLIGKQSVVLHERACLRILYG